MRGPFDISLMDLFPDPNDSTGPTPYQKYVVELERFYGAARAARILGRPVLYVYRLIKRALES